MEEPTIRSLKNDLKFGAEKQEEILEILTKYFDREIENTEKYCCYDGETKESNTRYEIKARRFKYSTYPTTIIPVHKKKGAEDGSRLIFVFGFTDGLYYIVYDEKLFSTFQTENITYYRNGIMPKPYEHYCIPCDLLIQINI